jgi:hypothetical protein
MRALIFAIALLTSGCASSTNDLIKEAHETGDWAAVNHRLAAEETRENSSPSCGDGLILMCTSRCECVSNQVARYRVNQMSANPFSVNTSRRN